MLFFSEHITADHTSNSNLRQTQGIFKKYLYMLQKICLIPYLVDLPNSKLKPYKTYDCGFCLYSSVHLTNFKAQLNTHTGHKP
ncbi:hypothetical protein JTE90_013757 [Oedothorax gibbosus]|uniref:C2H2-type domain-containing protein n=1 Tax=Oedothorax gibbosus TaxID=931172 RepID=A0AAV6V0Z7_9ARAC|nr:hypothetical protein JTE90_013757 [Oedothorax gibbosus]